MEDKCAKIYACRHYICILFSGANNKIAKKRGYTFRILFLQENNRCGLVN